MRNYACHMYLNYYVRMYVCVLDSNITCMIVCLYVCMHALCILCTYVCICVLMMVPHAQLVSVCVCVCVILFMNLAKKECVSHVRACL